MKKEKIIIYISCVFLISLILFIIFYNKSKTENTNQNIQENIQEENKSISTISKEGIEEKSKKEIVMKLISSAENSTLDWEKQYSYIENINDGRGYTAGIIGFTTKNGDLLDVVRLYNKLNPENDLEKFFPALEKVKDTDSENDLGIDFIKAWEKSAEDEQFRKAQDTIRDRDYFTPAVHLAKGDGLSPLGQYIYYDAAVVHGIDTEEIGENDYDGLFYIRDIAKKKAKTPLDGGDEYKYLQEFLKVRETVMEKEEAHKDISRIIAQRKFLEEKNYNLDLPLEWIMYGDKFKIGK